MCNFCLTIPGLAEQISRDQALRKAQQFLSQKGLPSSVKAAETELTRRRAQGIIQPDYYYVFNNGQNQGFVIISGDDRTVPVLGYSYSGSFDIDNLPPAMEDLLNHYSEEIDQIQKGGAVADVRRASHPSVAQMMTVKWNQGDPYNRKTMTGYYTNGKPFQCVTGCVATALAQVLYHQRFVNATQAEIPGYQNQVIYKEGTGYMNAVPAGTVLDWDNMVDSYNGSETEAQKDAVASLMMYCGVAVRMEYTKDESSASIADIPEAIKAYFGYSRGARYVQRSSYSAVDWENMIYNEVASGRPVIYSGSDQNGGGHAFILHGYDGEGRYAVNWGWGGYQDNYFMLDNLTPSDQGTGGGSGGYNYDQEAVIYLAKEDGTFQEDVIATVYGSAVGDVVVDNNNYLVIPTDQSYQASRNSAGGVSFALAISYTSDLANTYSFDLGYGIQNSEGKLVSDVVQLRSKWDLMQGQWRTTATGTTNFAPGWPEGTYYIKAYSRENGTTDWSLCKKADQFAVKMVVSSTTMNFEVVDVSTPNPDPDPQPEVSQAERDELAGLYAAQKTAIDAKIKAIDANNAKLTSISTTISNINNALAAVNTKITALESKLNSEYLTAEQKQTYNDQLAALKSTKSTLTASLTAASEKLSSLQATSNSLKSSLNTLLASIKTEAEAVASITTKAALNASTTKVNEIATQQSGYDVAAETAKVASLETDVAAISFTSLESDLTTLETTIDAAIEAGKKAYEEEQQAEKLTKAQEECQKAIDDLDEAIKTYNDFNDKLKDAHGKLKADMQEIEEAITLIKKQYAEIEKTLQELIEKQSSTRADASETIAALQEKLKKLGENIATLENLYAQISEQVDKLNEQLQQFETVIETATQARSQLQEGLSTAATATEVESLTSSVTKATNKLNSDGVSAYNLYVKNYNIVYDNLSMLIDDINMVYQQATSLQSEVEEVITAISQLIIDESEVVARYDMKGNPVDSTYKGVQIIRLKNGKTIKLNVK